MFGPNLKFVALPVPDQRLEFWPFGWGLQTPNLGEEEAVGVGDGTVRKSVRKFL